MRQFSVEKQSLRILKTVFGHDEFRPIQGQIVNHVGEGNDALVLMPTGGGKSICYQVPGLVREGVTVVISPLISLMQDQVQALRECDINARFYNSTLGLSEKREVEHEIREGHLDFLYLAPERLMLDYTLEMLDDLYDNFQIALFAIDEAHCVSKWGHDFRPEYRKLKILAERYAEVPRLALTATADKFTRADIIRELKLEKAQVFLGSFDRKNIFYYAEKRERQGTDQLLNILADREGESGIIYCLSRKRVEETALLLQERGYDALPYHAGMDSKQRADFQEKFIRDDVNIIVATLAFGMGIDKPDVRFVIHMDLPKNLENYYQETGRAGRDGLPSEAHLFYGARDVITLKQMMKRNHKSGERLFFEMENLEAMYAFAMSKACRRQILLQGFDEDFRGYCGHCDNCNEQEGETYKATEWGQKLLSLYYRTGILLNIYELCDLARGVITHKARTKGWFNLPNFGFLMDVSDKGVYFGIRQMMAYGLLKVDWGKGGRLQLTSLALDFLKGKNDIIFFCNPIHFEKNLKQKVKVVKEKRNTVIKEKSKKVIKIEAKSESTNLLSYLKEVRKKESKKRHVPAYVIFHDQTLIEMAKNPPKNEQDFLNLHGVGQAKMKKYAKVFLSALNEYSH